MKDEVRQKGGRRRLLVARFAAHLAHLMNEGDDMVEIQPFALDQAVLRTLSSDRYRYDLVGAGVIGLSEALDDQAALSYFEAVMKRPLFLARANHLHKGHELFVALCRRGVAEGWQDAQLTRTSSSPKLDSAFQPVDFPQVADRLFRLDQSIDDSNPALRTHDVSGPLYLIAGSGFEIVAEEMPVWGALVSGPHKLSKLTQKSEWDTFCSIVIKAVEAANAPWGVCIGLGLSPIDWAGALSTNTAKKVSAFLNEVADSNDIDAWRAAWIKRTIPGFDNADVFWHSELGRALRHHMRPCLVPFDELADEHDAGIEAELLERDEYEKMLLWYERQQLLDHFDLWLLRSVADGFRFVELIATAEAIAHFGKKPSVEEIETHAEELYGRLERISHNSMQPDDLNSSR